MSCNDDSHIQKGEGWGSIVVLKKLQKNMYNYEE